MVLRLYGAAAGFALAMLLGHVLGPSGFGAYSFAMGWLSIAVLATTLGFHHFAIRAIPPLVVHEKYREVGGFVLASVAITSGMAVTVSLAGWFILTQTQMSLEPDMVRALKLALLLLVPMTWNLTRTGLLQGLGHPVAGQFPERLVQSTLILLAVGAYWWTGATASVATVIYITLAAMLVATAIGLLPLARALKAIWVRPVRMHPRIWVVGAAKSSFLFAAASVMGATDTVMLGQLSSPSETGLYGVAARFFMLMSLPLSAASIVVSQRAAKYYAEGRIDELEDAIGRAAMKAVLASLVLAGLSTLAAFNAGFLFGQGFVGSFAPILILVWARAASSLLGPAPEVLANTAFIGTVSVVVAFSAVFNLGLNWLLIPHFGAIGAAVATATSFALMIAAAWWLVRRNLGISSNAHFGRRTS